jgi:hypothetical protein
MDTRPCVTEQELAAWIDSMQTMDATTLGDFERRTFPRYQHTSLVPLQIAIVNRRAQLERARWFRIRPSYPKAAGGFLAVGLLYAGEIVDGMATVNEPHVAILDRRRSLSRGWILPAVHSAETIDKCLRLPCRSKVILTQAVHQTELGPELGVQFTRRIAHHLQPAAARRAVGCEARDDDMAPRSHYSADLGDITRAVGWGGQEMKDCSVVPGRDRA